MWGGFKAFGHDGFNSPCKPERRRDVMAVSNILLGGPPPPPYVRLIIPRVYLDIFFLPTGVL